MQNSAKTLISLIIAALLGACTSQAPDATQTEVALNLTEAMHLTLTPIILATITPSETVTPTNTPTYTKTPQPQIAAQFTFVYEQTRVASTLAPTWTAAAQIASATAYQSTTDAIYRSLISSATAAMWTHTPTSTLVPSLTQIPIPTSTLPVIATFTETALPTLTPTETIDPIQAAETLFFGGLTQTATLWTPTLTETFTPSPNFTETVGARLTAILVASYTKTPTPPDTPTLTATYTPSSTAAPFPTIVSTLTASPSPTHSNTSVGQTPSPIETVSFAIDTDNVNLRNGPGTNYLIVDKAKKGDVFSVIAKFHDWYLVSRNSSFFWVNQSLGTLSVNPEIVATVATIPPTPKVSSVSSVPSPDPSCPQPTYGSPFKTGEQAYARFGGGMGDNGMGSVFDVPGGKEIRQIQHATIVTIVTSTYFCGGTELDWDGIALRYNSYPRYFVRVKLQDGLIGYMMLGDLVKKW